MRTLVLIAPFALAACMGPAPAPPATPYELASSAGCATTRFADGSAGDPAALDRLAGVYVAGRESITVSRMDGRFMAHRVSYGVRDLTAAGPDGLQFRDGCNQLYSFGGVWLTVTAPGGTTTRWQRRSY